MFVYLITFHHSSACNTLPSIEHELKRLQSRLLENCGLEFQLKIEYGYFSPEVELTCVDYRPAVLGDWVPQFSFKVWEKTKAVYLEGLKMPRELRKKGIGSFFVDWLKEFCRTFSLNYIVLGSYRESIGFWLKKGFFEITNQEYQQNYPVW